MAEMAFDDIDLLTMLQLVARVVADSLGNFCKDSYQRDAHPASGITFNSLPGGEDLFFARRLPSILTRKTLTAVR